VTALDSVLTNLLRTVPPTIARQVISLAGVPAPDLKPRAAPALHAQQVRDIVDAALVDVRAAGVGTAILAISRQRRSDGSLRTVVPVILDGGVDGYWILFDAEDA